MTAKGLLDQNAYILLFSQIPANESPLALEIISIFTGQFLAFAEPTKGPISANFDSCRRLRHLVYQERKLANLFHKGPRQQSDNIYFN